MNWSAADISSYTSEWAILGRWALLRHFGAILGPPWGHYLTRADLNDFDIPGLPETPETRKLTVNRSTSKLLVQISRHQGIARQPDKDHPIRFDET